MSGRQHRDVLLELKKRGDDSKTAKDKKKESGKNTKAHTQSRSTNTKNK